MEDIKIKVPEKEIIKPLSLSNCVGWDANITAYPQAVEYLYSNNCWDAYSSYPARFFWDTIKERVVFVQHLTLNEFSLATGRSLKGVMPKWYKYIALPGAYYVSPYLKGNTDTCYVVEDCASACSLTRLGDAIALCGTVWNTNSLVNTLNNIKAKNVVVYLDADAQEKANNLKRDLEGFGKFKSVKVVNLSEDAKHMSYDKLEKEMKNV